MQKNFLENVWKYEEDKLFKLDKRSKGKWACLNEIKPRKDGYISVGVNVDGKERKYYLHRLVYFFHNPTWDISDTSNNNSIDHMDQNQLNNRIENLNIVNNSQNNQNKSTWGGKEITGVHFDKRGSKKPWYAQWCEGGKKRCKSFETESEALAHRAEMVKLHYYQPCPEKN